MTYQEGDPNHLQTHNELTADVGDLASSMGVEVVLPDTAVVGSTGHVDDHNLIKDALDKISAEGSAGASWAQVISAPDAVTGSYYDDKGGQWAFYEWNAPGTFDVELSGGLLWVLAVSGGSMSYGGTPYDQGTPGDVTEGYWEFGPGTHTVTVGTKGQPNGSGDPTKYGQPSFIDDRITGYGTQAVTSWGNAKAGKGLGFDDGKWDDNVGYKSRITGDLLEYATGLLTDPTRPGQGGQNAIATPTDGCVIIATRIDVPTLPPAPPRLEVAPVVAKPVSISGPAVQEWLVRDKQGARKVVYFLPGNTGTARSLALTDEGAEALAARRDLLDAIATTEVPDDFDGDPVTLLPKKLRGELTGFVEVRDAGQPEAVFSVTLGAGVLPGVMVGAGGPGGSLSGSPSFRPGAGGAGGVIGQGAHVPVILPVQGTATYTVSVPSTAIGGDWNVSGGSCTIAVQGQQPFSAAVGGGVGCKINSATWPAIASVGGSGGGGSSYVTPDAYGIGAAGVPGQGHKGSDGTTEGTTYGGGGGGYSSPGNAQYGGAGFDLATALNLDANDGITGQFLTLVTDGGLIASGGTTIGNATPGGGGVGVNGHAKDFTGSGGGGDNGTSGNGGAGAVYIITDPT